jgi:hypothetical protein
MRKRWCSLAVILLVAATGCSQDEDGPLPIPSSAFPSATSPGETGAAAGPAPTGPSGLTGLPTTSPGAGTGNLTSGSLTFQTSGDLEVERTLRVLITAVYTSPPGGLALVWTAGGADVTVVGIGGSSFIGTRATSPTLTLTLTVQTNDGIASFLSIDGECDVTIDVALERELAGGFRCTDLSSDAGDVVAVSASFEAAG